MTGIEIIGFVDDDPTLKNKSVFGLSILGKVADLPKIGHDGIIIAIGHNPTRQRLCQILHEQGEQFVSAIHPSVIIGSDVTIGKGTMIMAGVVINVGTCIGENVILNTGCTIDHHNQIGDCVHVAPGVNTGGEVHVNEGALIGIGSTVMPGRSVGAWSIVGAGAVVTKDVPPKQTVVGIPAVALISNL